MTTTAAGELVVLPRTERPVAAAGELLVLHHEPVGERYMRLVLAAPVIAARALPGQFVMLTAARSGESTPALPRPMAIYAFDREAGTIEVLYAVVGEGTRRLREFRAGECLFVVGPLGRPFDVPDSVGKVLLVGRGIGTCSLTTVAQENNRRGIGTIAVVSARLPVSLIGEDLYRRYGAEAVYEVTDRYRTSSPEIVFDVLTRDWDAQPPELILTCGSRRLMLLCSSLARRWDSQMQVSVEAHMACGIGYCHGCATGARSEGDESPLVCVDGPVFGWRQAAPSMGQQ